MYIHIITGTDTVVLAGTEYQADEANRLSMAVNKLAVENTVVNNAAMRTFEKQTVKLAVENVLLRMRKYHPTEGILSSSGSSGSGTSSINEVGESNHEIGIDDSGGTSHNVNVDSSDVVYEKVKKVLVSYASHEEEEHR